MGLLAATELKDLADAIDTPEGEPRHVPFDAWGNRVDLVEPHPGWDADGAGRRRARRRRDGLRTRPRRLLAGPPVRPRVPLRPVVGAVQLPARDDRRRGQDAARRRRPRADRPGRPAPDLPRPRDVLDLGAVDDRTHRRVGRRPRRRPWPSRTVACGGCRGTKWFTSAITSEMALTLARPEGNGPGGKGLAMFYVEVRDDGAAAQRPPRAAAEAQARDQAAADRRARARRHRRAPRRAAVVGDPQHRADADRHPAVELGRRRERHPPRAGARARLRPTPGGLRCPPDRQPAAPDHARVAARPARGVAAARLPRSPAARPRGGRRGHASRSSSRSGCCCRSPSC